MNLYVLALRRWPVCVLVFLPMVAFAAETVQPGFVLHDEGKEIVFLSGASAGELCEGIAKPDNVCNTGTQLTVQGRDTCATDEGKVIPCTRYGYRYDYASAVPGTEIECTATRRDPYRSRQKSYTIPVGAESGSVFQPEWIPYAPVEQRMMLTEVHECVYLGAPLATIEYIISYEPSKELPGVSADARPSPNIDEPFLPGVPDACNYLHRDLASMWIRDGVRRYEGAIEHMPILRSHCAYFGEDDVTKIAKMEHKFHLRHMFDIDTLSRGQLLFNATFAAGGHPPESVRTDLGKVTFVYHLPDEDRSAISVVTGIQGPTNAGTPMELLAHYHVRTPDLTHQERLACLFDLARKSLELWFDHVSPDDNTVNPPPNPAVGATCPGVLSQ